MEQAKVLKVTIVERHSYFTFIPGASVRTYTDEQLKEMNDKEKEKIFMLLPYCMSDYHGYWGMGL
jgi:hypothetical protein